MSVADLAAARRAGLVLDDGAFELTGKFRDEKRKTRPEMRVISPIVVELYGAGSGVFLVVPAGYVSDGYSMPGKVLQLFQPKHARWLLPCLLHDWLYDLGLTPRDICDRVLLDAMRRVGVRWFQRLAVWVAVRLGGGGGYARPLPANLDLVLDARRAGLSEKFVNNLKERSQP